MTTDLASARDTALSLLARWDAQQTGYIRHRAERFATIARVVRGVCADRPRPRILDLASGPGSLGFAVREALPDAELVLADKDPALLAIARDAAAGDAGVRIVRADLADPGWIDADAFAEPFDAVVSSTALHWLRPEVLVRVYFALAERVRPGGILLNGDHLSYDPIATPTLRALAEADDRDVQQRAVAAGADTWDQWWSAVADESRYAEAMAERARVWGEELHVAPPTVTRGFHEQTLRSAGFAEVGTVWQYLDDYVVCAVR